MKDPKHIWQDDPKPGHSLPEDKLMDYLEGKLSGDELREVELWLSQEGLESDAIEGLQAMPSADARQLTSHINRQLKQSLRKKPRIRRRLLDHKGSWIAVVIILMLAALGFLVIYMSMKNK